MQLVLLFCILFSAFNCIVDYAEVKQDVVALLTQSKDFWPADYGNYGPFFIRQAWHCAGSYRKSDGRGGCDGGRQRFEPELSWDDNTNLDKAKRLLLPIKLKYGEELSWGDLIVLTGTYAIEAMGGPVLGFCGGRIDSPDGKESQLLGPTWIQNKTYPCKENGACKSPLGATTLGLIYVNPEGPMGNPDPYLSSFDIRDTFGRMDMSDWETVALIGGGHAFGKTHGACPLGPGPSPKQDPGNPWPGKCGSGKGKDTFTSGFEGPWTTRPTRWTNDYFAQLINYNWSRYIGPGGHNQWKAINGPSSVMALTSDVALTKDSVYRKIVQAFASNISVLEYYFKNAWYKLMSRDMGPVTRCVGPWVPPAQPFQFPLPPPPQNLPDFGVVKIMLKTVLTTPNKLIKPDYDARGPNYYGVFIHLAHQAATTFRHTDYLGGINGARIRFSPQSQWPTNKGIDEALQVLSPVKSSFKDLSWADLIALAGTYSLELSVNLTNGLTFCGGRTDAGDGLGSSLLSPNGNYSWTLDEMKLRMELNDLSNREYVALSGRYRSDEQMSQLGFYTPGWVNPSLRSFSNEYFNILLSETWELYANNNFNPQYKAKGKNIFMTQVDMNLLWDPALLAIVQDFASNKDIFLLEFTFAWTKLMNNDRFKGPDGNVCD